MNGAEGLWENGAGVWSIFEGEPLWGLETEKLEAVPLAWAQKVWGARSGNGKVFSLIVKFEAQQKREMVEHTWDAVSKTAQEEGG